MPRVIMSIQAWNDAADRFAAARSPTIGVATVLNWASSLAAGGDVLDLGCGHGEPLAVGLHADGYRVHGVEGSARLAAKFSERLPDCPILCEPVETSRLFGRTFDGVLAVGLMFLLPPSGQQMLIRKVAASLAPHGRFLFTSPSQSVRWFDVLTGLESVSLGRDVYQRVLMDSGLRVAGEYTDEGENHYYDCIRAGERWNSGPMEPIINSSHDITAVIEAGLAHGQLLLDEARLGPAFFDLRSGLAGELLQKFVNLRIPLAVVVAFPEAHGERFCELVYEHRNHPTVRFFTTADEAAAWLTTCP